MGVIAMEIADHIMSRGYSHWTRALYVYCDSCGSFHVRKALSARQWWLISISFLIQAVLTFGGVFPWPALIFVAIFLFMVVTGLWGLPSYVCRKCGKRTTIKYNTLNHPSRMGVVDVPKEQIEKFYLNYWPDDYDLDENLKPPKAD